MERANKKKARRNENKKKEDEILAQDLAAAEAKALEALDKKDKKNQVKKRKREDKDKDKDKKDQKEKEKSSKKRSRRRPEDEPCRPPPPPLPRVEVPRTAKEIILPPTAKEIIVAKGYAPNVPWKLTSTEIANCHTEHGCCKKEDCPSRCACLECPKWVKMTQILQGAGWFAFYAHPDDTIETVFTYRTRENFEESLKRLRLYWNYSLDDEPPLNPVGLTAKDMQNISFGFVDADKLETQPTYLEMMKFPPHDGMQIFGKSMY